MDSNQEKAVELLTEIIESIQPLYQSYWLEGMRSKIGLRKEESSDLELVNDLLKIMEGVDFTLVFRRLSQVLRGNRDKARDLFKDLTGFDNWEQRWQRRLQKEETEEKAIAEAMDSVNPIYIPRNHKVEEALSAATLKNDMTPFKRLLTIITRPFDEIDGNEDYTEPAPETNIPYKTFCGT